MKYKIRVTVHFDVTWPIPSQITIHIHVYHSTILMHNGCLNVGDLDFIGRSIVNKWVLNNKYSCYVRPYSSQILFFIPEHICHSTWDICDRSLFFLCTMKSHSSQVKNCIFADVVIVIIIIIITIIIIVVVIYLLLLWYYFLLILFIITSLLSNLFKGHFIYKICEEYDSLVYHHFGQSYMSQFTTVKN